MKKLLLLITLIVSITTTNYSQIFERKIELTGKLNQLIDTFAKMHNYKVVYKAALRNIRVEIGTFKEYGINENIRLLSSYQNIFRYTISKDSIITIYGYYEYNVHYKPQITKPTITTAYDTIRHSYTIYFHNVPLPQLLDTIANYYHINIQYKDCHLPPATVTGLIPIQLDKFDMQQILYNAHGLISPIYPTAMILSDKTILTEDIENNNPFTIDTTTSTTQPHYKLYYDTLRKYYAIEFKHLSPDTLLNIINEHNKYNIQFDQTAKGQMKTASGILPLYPHHLVVLQVLCKKYNMKYYESKPEQKQYYIIPRKN